MERLLTTVLLLTGIIASNSEAQIPASTKYIANEIEESPYSRIPEYYSETLIEFYEGKITEQPNNRLEVKSMFSENSNARTASDYYTYDCDCLNDEWWQEPEVEYTNCPCSYFLEGCDVVKCGEFSEECQEIEPTLFDLSLNNWNTWPDSLKAIYPQDYVPVNFQHLYFDTRFNMGPKCNTWAETGKDLGFSEVFIRDLVGDEDMIIAIIDSGIDFSWGDLEGRRWENTNEVAGNGIDDDGNGYVDDRYGYDFVSGTGSKSSLESLSNIAHGTKIARIIGSNDSREMFVSEGFDSALEEYYGYGINRASKLMNLKVVGSSGNTSNDLMAEAVRYAVDNGAKIINMSIGGGAFPYPRQLDYATFKSYSDSYLYGWEELYTQSELPIYYEALEYAWDNDVLVVMPSGNVDASAYEWSEYGLSAHPSVITVGGVQHPYMYWDAFSSIKGKKMDVVAPHVVSDGNFITQGGTSYSSALVTGLLSLVWGEKPTLKNHEIKKLLLETARDEVFAPEQGRLRAECDVWEENWDWSYVVSCVPGNITIGDVRGYSQEYGHGLINLKEMLDENRVRSVDVNSETGAVDGYVLPDTFLLAEVAPTEYQDWVSQVLEELRLENTDTDGDGIMDAFDECVDVAGIEENQGCPPLGLDDFVEVGIYPNPTRDIIHFRTKEKYKIFSLTGEFLSDGLGFKADLSGLDEGLYIINLKNKNYKVIKL